MKEINKILEVEELVHTYDNGTQRVNAVDGISFYIKKGETFGLVGESGCGKTTMGRMIVKLLDITSGTIRYKGKNITEIHNKKEQMQFRQEVQIVFQDPYASLDPRKKVRDIIAEGLDIHNMVNSKKERNDRVNQLLQTVGLNMDFASRYPHEFSGGQRQRIGIARALALSPQLIVCDEPISALDVSIQAQVVNLLKKLQKNNMLTYLFIAHDLSMVKYISDRIGVMYKGKLVELGEADEIYRNPIHPYTKSLISAIPLPDPYSERERKREIFMLHSDKKNLFWREIKTGHFVYCDEKGDF
ncbi:oligopeptide transport system ATP-binding protein [Anaerocolumna jejuensis DSM 15929]|uniref:Oligopeptide transport system ATP-binding protein n=1 Tax=Anaerocolumna jejuensis DSM 15929 TaxID=1121322 RepID=A0A1M6TX95_9FIRM|nr:ATP-binding cassette domain-containing protein [Anaerocolumna jejuensis]SHK61642.1 oligopeptide transport system ATP-binding protein [Anaerocolumna jejuensis DSM 15929]